MYNISLIGIVSMNLLLYNEYILIKICNKKKSGPSFKVHFLQKVFPSYQPAVISGVCLLEYVSCSFECWFHLLSRDSSGTPTHQSTMATLHNSVTPLYRVPENQVFHSIVGVHP
jgi:hypothetical protein